MKNCPHCSHPFDESQPAPASCPACGRHFTVSDIGAATLAYENPLLSQPTIMGLPPGMTPPGTPPPGALTLPIEPNIGATIQSGKFSPSLVELAEGVSSAGSSASIPSGSGGSIDRTLDSGSIGSLAQGTLRDMTQMWDSSHLADSSGGSSLATLDSSFTTGSASGKSPSAAGSGLGSSQRGESLEQSLVIQPRVLRPENEPSADPKTRIDYNLINKLGEGGMGIVYAARQSSIRRTVALKMLKKAGAEQSSHREKFLAEAVITGDLEHPNIVPIYDLGRDEAGAIFYAMKHVKGTPWDKTIRNKSLFENIETLMKVADAVAFAHSKNVIHRDLKPENVMLGDFGEVLVMDWGLALSLNNPPSTFAMGGTPAYMAPEMAFGPLDSIGVGSDVYLLGAILFEIVTGQRPHSGTTVTRCLMAAAKNEIVPTEKAGELIEIAHKAMATKPKDRYASCRDFQTAIREYQSHTESIALGSRAQHDLEEARRNDQYDTYARALFAYQEAYTLWEGNTRAKLGVTEAALAYADAALRKGDYDLGLSLLDKDDPEHQELVGKLQKAQGERESRQRRLRTARRVGVALVATILVIVTGAFFWIRREAERAKAAEVIAKKEQAEALRQKGVAEEQRKLAVEQQKVAEEQRKLAVQQQQEAERQTKIAEEQRKLAVAQKQVAEEQTKIAEEQTAKAVTAQNEAEVARKKEEYEGYIAKLGLAAAKIEENSFEQALLLLNECPEHLRNWEWGRLAYLCNRDVRSYDAGQPIEAIAASPDGKRVAAGGWGGEVHVFDVETGKELVKFPTGGEYVFSLAFSPDGAHLAAGTNAKPNYLTIHNSTTGEPVRSLPGHKDAVLSVAYSRDGQKLLTGSYDNTARLWDLPSGTARQFAGHDWWIWSANFSPDEQRIVTGSQDGSAIVWNVATGEASPPYLGHEGPVYSAVFSPEGTHVATGSYDKRILLWRPEDLRQQDLEKVLSGAIAAPPGTPAAVLEEHTAAVRSVRFSRDGRLLLSSGNDNAICVWDVATRQMVKKLRGHASRVSAADFVAGGDRVVSGAYDHQAKLWSISKYEEVRVLGGRVLKGHRDAVLGAAFSPDGNTVVTASRDRSAIAWNVVTGAPLRSYDEGHAYLASAAIFFPNGKHVLTSAMDNTTRIWDVAAGTQQATLIGTGPSAAVALSTDGSWIVSGSDDKTLKIWNPEGKLLRQFAGFPSDVTALTVAPSDQQILTGDSTGRCRLIKADTGETIWESRAHSRGITAVAFLPGGQRVLSASLDNTVGQWDVVSGGEDRSRVLKHPDAVTSLSVSTDGLRALTACADKIVRLWDIDKAQIVLSLPASEAATTDVSFSPDGKRAVTTSADNRLRLWNLDNGQEIFAPSDGKSAFLDLSATTLLVWSAAFSSTGDRLLTVGGAEAHLWDSTSAKQLMTFSPQSAVSSVQFSKDGNQLVTGSWDNAARVWNSATGAALAKLGGVHTRFVNASVFSPDGTQVLTASDDKTVRLWNAATGKPLGVFVGHEGRVTDVAFSSDGKRVLTASDDKTARIWDAATFKELHVLRGHDQALLCAEFSFDDKQIITGSDDTTARLWNGDTGEPLAIILAGHTASVTSAAFTRDGKRAITGSKDITTKVWDPATGKEILTLTGHTQEITTVAVAPDGRSILTGSRDGTAIVWLSVPWQTVPAAAAAAITPPVAAAPTPR